MTALEFHLTFLTQRLNDDFTDMPMTPRFESKTLHVEIKETLDVSEFWTEYEATALDPPPSITMNIRINSLLTESQIKARCQEDSAKAEGDESSPSERLVAVTTSCLRLPSPSTPTRTRTGGAVGRGASVMTAVALRWCPLRHSSLRTPNTLVYHYSYGVQRRVLRNNRNET